LHKDNWSANSPADVTLFAFVVVNNGSKLRNGESVIPYFSCVDSPNILDLMRFHFQFLPRNRGRILDLLKFGPGYVEETLVNSMLYCALN